MVHISWSAVWSSRELQTPRCCNYSYSYSLTYLPISENWMMEMVDCPLITTKKRMLPSLSVARRWMNSDEPQMMLNSNLNIGRLVKDGGNLPWNYGSWQLQHNFISNFIRSDGSPVFLRIFHQTPKKIAANVPGSEPVSKWVVQSKLEITDQTLCK